MFHSVRAQLTLWYTAILALVLVTFSSISYVMLARAIRAATDASLADTGHELAAAFARDAATASPPAKDEQLDFRYSDRELMVLDGRGAIVASSPSHFGAAEMQRIARHTRNLDGFATISGTEDGIRIFAVPVHVGGKAFRVVVAADLDAQGDRLEEARAALLFGIPIALLIASAGGYLLARKSLAPVTTMSAKAREIGAATLSERIAVGNERDELGFLATTLNDLLERLQRAFESQRRFMADASHELRTPVAIIQGEADVALSRPRSSADYRESIEIMQKAARKLTRIVQDLFLLARSDAGSYPITRTRFYLDELLGDCVRSMQSLASAKRIALHLDASPEVIVAADEELVQRLVTNLVDNAIKFTPSGGAVHVEASSDGVDATIRVRDDGPGVAPEDRARIFERFYRARGIGGSAPGAGLGLAIARWIAEVHGGTLVLAASEGGAEFVATIPAASEEIAAAERDAV